MLPDRLTRLIHMFAKLPGVGDKTAQRFVLHLVSHDPALAQGLGHDLLSLEEHIARCVRCGNIAERSPGEQGSVCRICRDHRRQNGTLCVVARVQDLMAIERSGAMRGRYFVLGKLLSPLDGIGTEDLPLQALRERIAEDQVTEVLVATPPSVDGEATSLLLVRELSMQGVTLTRLASGIPHGGDLEFADQITMGRAIEGRKQITG